MPSFLGSRINSASSSTRPLFMADSDGNDGMPMRDMRFLTQAVTAQNAADFEAACAGLEPYIVLHDDAASQKSLLKRLEMAATELGTSLPSDYAAADKKDAATKIRNERLAAEQAARDAAEQAAEAVREKQRAADAKAQAAAEAAAASVKAENEQIVADYKAAQQAAAAQAAAKKEAAAAAKAEKARLAAEAEAAAKKAEEERLAAEAAAKAEAEAAAKKAEEERLAAEAAAKAEAEAAAKKEEEERLAAEAAAKAEAEAAAKKAEEATAAKEAESAAEAAPPAAEAAAVTPKTIKALRDATGAGMMDCKKALLESNGDAEVAAEYLRKKGLAKADKKASRVAAEGKIAFVVKPHRAVMVEVNCETDFVAKDSSFLNFCDKVAGAAVEADSDDVASLMQTEVDGETLEATRQALVATIGENIQVRRMASRGGDDSTVGCYIHMNKIGALVELEGGNEQLCNDVAMHVAAMNPPYATADEVPADILDKERKILSEQALESGKPPEIVEKMVEGRIRKYLEEICLVSQNFVRDSSKTVEKYLEENGAKMIGFTRIAVGEGIEKKEDDFAAEVAAMAGTAPAAAAAS